VASVSFRSFGWVLLREAALRIISPDVSVPDAWSRWRLYLAKVDGARARALAAKALVLFPQRRIF